MASDPTLALQGEASLFYLNQNNLASAIRYAMINGYTIPQGFTIPKGELTQVQVPDPNRPNKFNNIRITRGAPDLGEFTMMERYKNNSRGNLYAISLEDCEWLFIVPEGVCNDLEDIDDWQSVWVFMNARTGDFESSEIRTFDSNDPVEHTLPVNFVAAARTLPVGVSPILDAVLLTKVVDLDFADSASCGNCKPYSNGEDEFYALTDNRPGSPGLSSQIVYSKDGGVTGNTESIWTLTGAAAANAVRVVGKYVVAWSATDESHHYAERDDFGTGVNIWTEVTTGYESGGGPTCAHVASAHFIVVGGLGGYLYKIEDVTLEAVVIHDASLTTEDTNSIHSDGINVLSGHDNNVLLYSSNGGSTFRTVTGPAVGVNVNAVWVVGKNTWWAAMANGTLWYTMDAGVTWTQRTLPGQSGITAINDMKWNRDYPVFGWLAITDADGGKIMRTITNGARWSIQEPYVRQPSTTPSSINAIALAGIDTILGGGEETAAGDGSLLLGTA